MSNLEELKNKLCPNGVEFKKLEEVCSFIYGYTEKARDEGNVRFVRITDISEIGCLNAEGAKYINLTPECEKYLLKRGDLLTARAGATYGKTLYFDEDYPAVYASYLIKLNLDNNLILNRYYWHFAKSSYYWKQADKLAVGGAQPNLNANSLAKIIVPIPPLEVQEEIVRILDPLTKDVNELVDLLKREQELRKKQYSYYRDKLLTFEEDTPKVKLGEIGKIFRGSGITKDQIKNVGTPCVRYGEIYTKYGIYFDKCYSYIDENDVPNKKYFSYGDILFAVTGENVIDIGKCTAYVGTEQCIAGGDMIILTNHNQEPKYLSYALSTTNAIKQKTKNKRKNTRVHLSLDEVRNFEIPLPPLEKQKEIVSILDNLEQYYNNLHESLPAEIEKRKKQYAYYRDELLRFERK